MYKMEGAILQVKKRLKSIKGNVDSKFTDIDWLKVETDDIIEEYMRNGGYHPISEISKELSLMSILLAKTHENIERLNITQRTREEWTAIEQQLLHQYRLIYRKVIKSAVAGIATKYLSVKARRSIARINAAKSKWTQMAVLKKREPTLPLIEINIAKKGTRRRRECGKQERSIYQIKWRKGFRQFSLVLTER